MLKLVEPEDSSLGSGLIRSSDYCETFNLIWGNLGEKRVSRCRLCFHGLVPKRLQDRLIVTRISFCNTLFYLELQQKPILTYKKTNVYQTLLNYANCIVSIEFMLEHSPVSYIKHHKSSDVISES